MQVEELLNKKKVEFRLQAQDYLIRCINPEHEDRNPSMRIDRITGVFNCFSCGYKGNIFTHFGERPNLLQLKRETLKKTIEKKRAESIGLGLPKDATPYIGDWRGLSPKTYADFEAFTSVDPDHIGRIVFPIRDFTGRIVAFCGRHTGGGTPRYKISPRKASVPLFPKVQPTQGSIVLVEGIFDMLNLHDKGIKNAVCSFGTSTVTNDKLQILKMLGTSNIDIFFDGDDPGQKAAKKVQELCEIEELTFRNICLDDTDPGDLSENRVLKLRDKLYG